MIRSLVATVVAAAAIVTVPGIPAVAETSFHMGTYWAKDMSGKARIAARAECRAAGEIYLIQHPSWDSYSCSYRVILTNAGQAYELWIHG